MREQDPGDRFAAIARDLHRQPSEGSTVERITALALENVTGCHHAGISLIARKHHITTVAATDEVVIFGDRRQYELGEGPCLDSIHSEQRVYAPRLVDDARWPRWASEIGRHGIRSMLCLQLFTSEREYGALNPYSEYDDGFDDHDQQVGLALAAHAAVALAASRKIEQLNNALGGRTVIGQAEGILMERFGLTADQAFNVLTRVSQQENRRLALVAQELVETRSLPESDIK
jgi:GAF domain-containing protein